MDETVGAQKRERTPGRLGYRSGYYPRTLVTRVGKLELRVPQDRQGRFRSTRKVKEITEQLCGHEFSASTVSRINQTLDEDLSKFANRTLEEPYPYLVL